MIFFIYEILFSIWNCDSAKPFGTSWHHYLWFSEYFTCQCFYSSRRWHTVKVVYYHLIARRLIFVKNISLNPTNLQLPDTICTSWIPLLPSVAYPIQCWWVKDPSSMRSKYESLSWYEMTQFWFEKGGIKAVVWTDVVQAFVMVLSILLVAFYGVQKVGGLTEVWHRAVDGGRLFPPV